MQAKEFLDAWLQEGQNECGVTDAGQKAGVEQRPGKDGSRGAARGAVFEGAMEGLGIVLDDAAGDAGRSAVQMVNAA